MDETDYTTLFGLNEGANEQEPAEPAEAGNESAGANEQDPAAPATGTDTPDQGDEQKQTPDQNAAFAAARRKAEQELARYKQEEQQRTAAAVDAAIASMGMTDDAGKPITTKAEMDAFNARRAEERRTQVLSDTGMNEAEFQQFVDNLPQVRAAKDAAARAAEAERRANDSAAKAAVEEQIKAIGALDPSVKTLEDVLRLPNYQQIYARVQKGASLKDAFILENFDALRAKDAAAGRQAALNATATKGHLAPTQTRGQGAQTVPADVKALYRELNPDATDAEIQNHYNKYHKG